jgi:hypothetical protein
MNVSPDEKLTRFIFSKSHFSVQKREVKFRAFIPKGTDISVYRISDLSEPEVWEIGRKYVQRDKRSIKARADLLAEVVYENHLTVILDPIPHELHANITPFPTDKSARDRIARKLALASQLVIMPPA